MRTVGALIGPDIGLQTADTILFQKAESMGMMVYGLPKEPERLAFRAVL